MLVDLEFKKGEVTTTLEAEEVRVARAHGIPPHEWDDMPVSERVRLIAAARDQSDLDYIANLPDDDRRQLVGQAEWVVVGEGN